MSKLQDLSRQLVGQLAPCLNDDQRFYAAEYVQKEISSSTKGSTRREWVDVLTILNSTERASRVRVQENLADALQKCVAGLANLKEVNGSSWEDDLPIQVSNLSQHIQLLLNLSNQPTPQTQEFAQTYLTRKPNNGPTPDQILYDEIMAEPFTGTHWGKGYDEEVLDGWTDSESEISTSNSEDEEVVVTPFSSRGEFLKKKKEQEVQDRQKMLKEGEERLERAVKALEGLEGAYWNSGGNDLPDLPSGLFGWKDLVNASNPAGIARDPSGNQSPKVISTCQIQREMLFALSGRPGVVFSFDEDGMCKVNHDHPLSRHFTPQALTRMLERLSHRATQLNSIRLFVRDTMLAPSSSVPSPTGKTTQAFAEACQSVVRSIERWVSTVELAFIRGVQAGSTIPSTPLSLLKQLDDRFGQQIDNIVSLIPLSDDPTILLNSIYLIYTTSPDSTSTQYTLELFLRTVKPVWTALGSWLHDGMPIPKSLSSHVEEAIIDLDEEEDGKLDDDFWVKRDRDVSWTDEDFWEAGYVVSDQGWPAWMGETMELVIEAGKARGLLKGLMGYEDVTDRWQDLKSLLPPSKDGSTVDIAKVIEESVSPACQIAIFRLRRVLEEECGLEQHLDAIERVMYLKGHLSMTRWLDNLSEQISKGKRWTDMSSLTSSLRDAIEETEQDWLNPSAVRLSPCRDAAKSRMGTAREVLMALGNLKVGYIVPFPLSVLFTSTSLDLRSKVFGFLVQLDYTIRSVSQPFRMNTTRHHSRLRQQVLWFLQTVWTWLTDRVISIQTVVYREQLAKSSSLKEMISLELKHARSIRDFAFRHDHHADVYDRICEIMEIALSISSCNVRVSNSQRAMNENDDDEPVLHPVGDIEHGAQFTGHIGDLPKRVDGVVKEIRGEVERLAMDDGGDGEGERRQVWGMLSFALEGWDR